MRRTHEQAMDMLLNPSVHEAFDLEKEPRAVREKYVCIFAAMHFDRAPPHGGRGALATVYCAAGDLNGSKGSHLTRTPIILTD